MLRASILLFSALMLLAADAADAVKQAAEGWTASAVKQDAAGLKKFLADDLSYSHSNGRTQTKAEYIAAVTNGPARYEAFTFSGVNVKFYGKAAVLTGFVDVKMVNTDSFRVRTLQVYVENGGQWQMAAHQSARVGR